MSRIVMKSKKCSHPRTRGVYGDEINHSPTRVICLDCHRYLEQDVSMATVDYISWLLTARFQCNDMAFGHSLLK